MKAVVQVVGCILGLCIGMGTASGETIARQSTRIALGNSVRDDGPSRRADYAELRGQAEAAYREGRLDAVVDALSALPTLGSVQPDLALLLGKALHRLGRFDEALATYRALAMSDSGRLETPGYVEAQLIRARALLNVAAIHQALAAEALDELGRRGYPHREMTVVQSRNRALLADVDARASGLARQGPESGALAGGEGSARLEPNPTVASRSALQRNR